MDQTAARKNAEINRGAVAAVFLALALVTFFVFPGHTWLQQDSQIYAAVLEHQSDARALANDILVQRPHVAFTLYDEVTRGLHALTGWSLGSVLALQQIATRALGIWGLYLMALAMGSRRAWLVASVCALGATIAGPSVLTFEYEPTPRAFAIPLVICGIGLAARGRYLAAAFAGAAAFLYHPPSALPFWLMLGVPIAVRPRRPAALLPLAGAAVVLAIAAHGLDAQPFFGRIPAFQEQLQRMRASYNWVSLWPARVIWNHVLLFGVVLAAYSRLRDEMGAELKIFALGLPVLGVFSMPLSYLLLERLHWVLVPQYQPMRTLLFVALMAQFLCAAAGVRAAGARRWVEAGVWFALGYALPLQPVLTEGMDARRLAVLALLALIGVTAARYSSAIGVAAFLAVPLLAGVVNYPKLHTPELAQLSAWARASTPRDAVFLFPDSAHLVYPGVFRAEAVRAVYVDWKGGGEVNYFPAFAAEWQRRWGAAMGPPFGLARYASLGIDYVVLLPAHRLAETSVFENGSFVVYRVK